MLSNDIRGVSGGHLRVNGFDGFCYCPIKNSSGCCVYRIVTYKTENNFKYNKFDGPCGKKVTD